MKMQEPIRREVVINPNPQIVAQPNPNPVQVVQGKDINVPTIQESASDINVTSKHHNVDIIMQEPELTQEEKAIIATAEKELAEVKKSQKLKNPGGRPSKITPVAVLKLIGAFQNGMDVDTACQYAGISRATFYRNMSQDEEFRDIIKDAQDWLKMQASDRLKKIITEGSDRDAAPLVKWYLEKKMPEEYGDKPAIPPGGIHQNNFYGLTKEDATSIINGTAAPQDSDPSKLLEDLEAQPVVDNGAETQSAEIVHPEEVQREHSGPVNLL